MKKTIQVPNSVPLCIILQYLHSFICQDDNQILENSLKEAHRLLKEQPAPVASAEAAVTKDPPKRRALPEPPRPDSSHGKRVPEEPTPIVERDSESGLGTALLSDVILPPAAREPRVTVGQPVTMSEELSARLRVLADLVGKDNVAAIRSTVQRDLDNVAQMSRTLVVPAAAAAENQARSPCA